MGNMFSTCFPETAATPGGLAPTFDLPKAKEEKNTSNESNNNTTENTNWENWSDEEEKDTPQVTPTPTSAQETTQINIKSSGGMNVAASAQKSTPSASMIKPATPPKAKTIDTEPPKVDEPDYFSDMTVNYVAPKKIDKEIETSSPSSSNRLKDDEDLKEVEKSGAWGDDLDL